MLDETVNHPDYPIRPEHLDGKKLPWDSFNNHEIESWSNLVVLYAQANCGGANSWAHFTSRALIELQAERGKPFKHPESFPRSLDEMVEKGLLSSEERDGITWYVPTHKLVAGYFASAPSVDLVGQQTIPVPMGILMP